jgi:hypothetical protein
MVEKILLTGAAISFLLCANLFPERFVDGWKEECHRRAENDFQL